MFRHMTAVVLLCVASLAQAGDAATGKLNKLLQGISSMQADFKQQSFDAKGKPLQSLSGKMQVKRPGFFRWDTQQPFPQLIVANGNKVWIYDPELEQVTIQKLDNQVGNTPALLLSGNPQQLSEAFTIKEEGGSKTEAAFILQPKAADALFDTLRVSFKGRELVSMTLKDSLGQKTDIRFSQIAVNPKLADSLFQFTPPKGADVINEL